MAAYYYNLGWVVSNSIFTCLIWLRNEGENSIWKLLFEAGNFRTDYVEKSKNILFKFSGCRIVFEICFYEIDERFPIGLVIFGVVFN